MARSQPLETRFWSKVDKRGPNECWPWRGSRNQKGYGRIIGSDGPRPAHQVSWELANNAPFPSGRMGCHSCDNPSCVNPSHIWPGTALDNNHDCSTKSGRLTHCKRGHEYTQENTDYRRGKKAHRICRTCVRQRLARGCPEVAWLIAAAQALLDASERHIFGDECLAERTALRAAIQDLAGAFE